MTHWNVAQVPSAGSGRSMLRPYKSAGDPHFPSSYPISHVKRPFAGAQGDSEPGFCYRL